MFSIDTTSGISEVSILRHIHNTMLIELASLERELLKVKRVLHDVVVGGIPGEKSCGLCGRKQRKDGMITHKTDCELVLFD